ncbi:MAG: VOC family protein [Pseudoclavibacter sp.]
MQQNVHFMTFATEDLDAARRFYAEGLGWQPLLDVPGGIIFFQVAPGAVLGLFDADSFNRDLADGADRATVSGVTLSHNVDDPDEVRAVVEAMASAGGTVLKAATPTASSGRSPTTRPGASPTTEPSRSAEQRQLDRSQPGRAASDSSRVRPPHARAAWSLGGG